MLPILNVVRADAARAAHIDEKRLLAADKALHWVKAGPHHYVAEVPGKGSYVVRRVDSKSRVRRQRYRWLALWAPIDSPDVQELALEKLMEWGKAVAMAHYKRSK